MRKLKYNDNILNDDGILNVLKTTGRSKSPEDINFLELYYKQYDNQPKLYRFTSNESASGDNYYRWDLLKLKLKSYYKDSEIIFSDNSYDVDKDIEYTKQEIWNLRDGLMLKLEGSDASDFYLIDFDLTDVTSVNSYNLFLVDKDFPEIKDISDIFKECRMDKTDTVSIGLVSWDDGSFFVKDFDIKENTPELTLLDEHYGDGFEDFNNELIKKLTSETKGLTLFHGIPGSGKTTVIRYLLKKLKEIDKNNNILYFPPVMVGTITDPNFINFISDWVSDSKGNNYLLIEDAEPLLESRDSTRNMGITNLLNLTDGLLNDIFNIQIIATFNTKLSNIDDALLRPERLMARKEFTVLTVERGKDLASKIGVDAKLITKKMTLAEIYSFKNDRKTITHDINGNGNGNSYYSKPIGFAGKN